MLRTYLRFFIPLALYNLLVGVSGVPITMVLTRTGDPAAALVVYTLSTSLVSVFAAPLVSLRFMVLVFGFGGANLRSILKVYALFTGAAIAAQLLVAYSPLSGWVFVRMGVTPGLLAATVHAFQIAMWYTVSMVLRDIYQAALLVRKQSAPVVLSMGARLLVIILWISACLRLGLGDGAVIGVGGLLLGLSVEAAANYLAVRYWPAGSEAAEAEQAGPLSLGRGLQFALPLLAADLLAGTFVPLVQAAIGRTSNPAVNLAAYGLANTVGIVALAPLSGIAQFTMVFGKGRADRRPMLAFTAGVAAAVTSVLVFVAFTAPGMVLIRAIFAPGEQLWVPTRAIMAAMIAQIPVLATLQIMIGRRLMSGATDPAFYISRAAAALVVGIAVLIPAIPLWVGATIGAWAITAARLVEVLILGIRQPLGQTAPPGKGTDRP